MTPDLVWRVDIHRDHAPEAKRDEWTAHEEHRSFLFPTQETARAFVERVRKSGRLAGAQWGLTCHGCPASGKL